MCGIFGIDGSGEAANLTYLGLYALQHRGQESAGMVSWDGERLHVERGMGHVADIFRASTLKRLPGTRAIGHTRYSTAGHSVITNAQPIVVKTAMGPLGIVHNGNLVNAGAIRARLEREGSIFQTTSDTEVILHLMARNPRGTLVDTLVEALLELRGAYSLLIISDQALIAVRDPYGFRPLSLGEHPEGVCFASESCAFDLMEAKMVRRARAGRGGGGEEWAIVERHHLPTVVATRALRVRARLLRSAPDSMVFGDPVARVRQAMGAQLAREAPAAADVVVPVPDSGVQGAIGYSRESGLPVRHGD
jgi:amidophosphoribosyltransferase